MNIRHLLLSLTLCIMGLAQAQTKAVLKSREYFVAGKYVDAQKMAAKGLEDDKVDINHPGWFLIRESRKRWGNHKLWVSTLRTSQMFMRFVKFCWMDSIYPYPNPWMERIFDPRLFFSDELDAIGFMAHMKNKK